MNSKFTALLAECKTYINTYEKALVNGKLTPKQTQYYKQLKDLLPLLEEAISPTRVTSTTEAPKNNATSDFSALYNENFAYLNKFTAVPQKSIKHILAYQQRAQKMAKLYANIPPETIKRQAAILPVKKKAVDKWLAAFEKQLSSPENQASLETRFQELLEKANAALSTKGLETVTASNNTTI